MMNILKNWGPFTGMIAAVAFAFTHFATAADLERIESRYARADLRTMCLEYATADEEDRHRFARFVMESLRDLCEISDDHRCDLHSAEEVCDE